jgi:hypothetical protein
MAVFKIFPIKDNFISSLYPNKNYGRDEVLEISTGNNISRILMLFSNTEINNIIDNISGSFNSNLKLYYSNAVNIPENYIINISPISQSWVMGTGRSGDEPNPQNGSCWDYSDINNNVIWNGFEYDSIFQSTQSFSYQDSKDINCDITNIVEDWYSSSVINNGLLVKFPQNLESSSNSTIKYFSIDTHTIYPPHIEIYWSDVLYSSSLSIVNNNFKSVITNLKKEYSEHENFTFRIKNRDEYPIRNFQTSSLYLNSKILPEESYWCLKDVKTKEIIIDYHNIGTKIGADNNGNYFNINFNGLQPERYYQIVIKTIINNNIIIIDDNSNYFKLIR